jgi:serine/threonine protein kinase
MEHEERLKAALADRYQIERELGSGGMATVYLAQDLKVEKAQVEPGVELVCINESVYQKALTRDRAYVAVDVDLEKRQVRVKADHGRLRWFPQYCFVLADEAPAKLTRVVIEDAIRDPKADWIEVAIYLADGSRRWCALTTAEHLLSTSQQVESEGSTFRLQFGLGHVLVVDELTEQTIKGAVNHVYRQGDLLKCTLPFAS